MIAIAGRFILRSVLLLSTILAAAISGAQSFSGTYSAPGDNALELKQTGDSVTGVYRASKEKFVFAGKVQGGKVTGEAKLEGTPVKFLMSFAFQDSKLVAELNEEDEQGKPLPGDAERIVFTRQGDAPAEAGNATAGAPALDGGALKQVADKVKTNFKRDKGDKVLSAGDPPLTVDSVASFAELMRLCFGAILTETEFEATKHHFVMYYEKSDDKTKQMLAGGWQNIVEGLAKETGDGRAKSIEEVRTVLDSRFTAGAKAGMPWAIAMHDAIVRRTTQVAKVGGALDTDAQKAGFHTEMTEADLDAAMEMLYFMWVACGRDTSLVTPQAVAVVRDAIVRGFGNFPPQVQAIFANSQKVYSSLRGEWAQSSQAHRQQMAQAFSYALDQLGLTVPRPNSGGGWSKVGSGGGQSHGEWAASMVQGLAGSSYNNAWSSH